MLYALPSLPNVFGNVFSNKRARSGSFSRAFISVMTFWRKDMISTMLNDWLREKMYLYSSAVKRSTRRCGTHEGQCKRSFRPISPLRALPRATYEMVSTRKCSDCIPTYLGEGREIRTLSGVSTSHTECGHGTQPS